VVRISSIKGISFLRDIDGCRLICEVAHYSKWGVSIYMGLSLTFWVQISRIWWNYSWKRLQEKLSNLLGAPYCFRVHLFLMDIASKFTFVVCITLVAWRNWNSYTELSSLTNRDSSRFLFVLQPRMLTRLSSAGSVALVSTLHVRYIFVSRNLLLSGARWLVAFHFQKGACPNGKSREVLFLHIYLNMINLS
jgi:hypothetical protein